MDCFLTPTHRLRRVERRFLADHLTRPGSDFQTALLRGEPTGTIALCLDQGEIVGWARTEKWQGMATLEAFVAVAYRRRGICTYCVSGLVAQGAYRDEPVVAVFAPSMAQLARSFALPYTRYTLKPDGTWSLV